MSTDWGSATDAKGGRISLLHDDTTSETSSQVTSHTSSNSCRDQSAALPPISPLLNVSYPGAAQTSIKRSLNISTSYAVDQPYYAQPTSGSSVSSPQATTPGFSEHNSAPASTTYSPQNMHSALDPSLTSSSHIRDCPTFSRSESFSMPRDSVPRYTPVINERLYGSQAQLGYSASPPSMSDRSYQSYMRRGDDLRRSESYGTTSSGSANSSMDSEGPFTPQDEMPSWGGGYRLSHSSSDAYHSLLGKRSRDERDGECAGGYQYPPPPTGPEEETRYEERYEDLYTRDYKSRATSYNYPPPPAPYREALSYAPPLAPSYPSTSATSWRYSPIRTQPTRSSSLRQPLTTSSPSHASGPTPPSSSSATPSATNPKKFPCRFLHTPPIYCTQTFTTSGHASRHAKIHKEEKGISCVYPGCGKRFTRGDNMKQHLETHFRVRGGRGKKDLKSKNEDANEGDKESRAEMQRLLREGAEKRERGRGVREGRRREREEMVMSMSVSPRTIRGGKLEIKEGKREVPNYNAPQMDALDALATAAVGRK